MSRPCCLAICSSSSALAVASWRRRPASISASARTRCASSLASISSRDAASSARVLICAADSRAVATMRVASSPKRPATTSSSSSVNDGGGVCSSKRSSFSSNVSRSCSRANSAATMRRNSRTSSLSKPLRDVVKVAVETCAGDDGSGRAIDSAIGRIVGVLPTEWVAPALRHNPVETTGSPPRRTSASSASCNVATGMISTSSPTTSRARSIPSRPSAP